MRVFSCRWKNAITVLAVLIQVESSLGFLSSSTTRGCSDNVSVMGSSSCQAKESVSALTMAVSKNSNSDKIPPNLKILILPGFGNDAADYLMKGSLVDSLQEQGWDKRNVDVLRVTRADWLQVFVKGAFDIRFWMATADPTRQAFRWYLERISQQIQELCQDEDENDSSVILVGHSAGGWLGRAALGFGSQIVGNGDGDTDISTSTMGPPINLDNVAGLVSLGAPHLPPPASIMDMTRGALQITNDHFPGAYHKADDGLFYVTAIGLSVQGEEQQRSGPLEPTTISGFAYNSYEAVCGDGTVVGDGVVPYSAGHLDDARQLDLEGVLHSINAPDNWYGSSQVIERWHKPMLEEVKASKKLSSSTKGANDVMATLLDAFAGAFKS